LAVLEALMKWEDKLLDHHFKVVTDHHAFIILHNKCKLSLCLEWWIEYLSCFDFEPIYVEGLTNHVADS
ncbi:uncharacterized protein LAESUDRAFT_628617, partial [Laetiporus sulphureus 93-53]